MVHMNFDFLIKKRRKGQLLIGAILAAVIIGIISSGLAATLDTAYTNLGTINVSSQALDLADSKKNTITVADYTSVVSEARAAVPSTSFEREVIVGPETDNSSGGKEKTVTINVYSPSTTSPLATRLITLSSQGSVTAPDHGKKLFTSNGTWTVPNVKTVWVNMAGGGGGGAGGANQTGILGGGGGGAAAYYAKEVTVVPGETISITIGAGGGAGATTSYGTGRGGTGGTTRFGTYLSADGGYGAGTGGNYGCSTPGAAGGAGGTSGASGTAGGNGGNSLFGMGGLNGGPGAGYGAGGGGAMAEWNNGGSGTAGFVLVEW